MPDDTPDTATGELEDESPEEASQPGSQPDTTDGEEPEGDEGERQTVPLRRFKDVNARFRQAENVANWYRENIGDPKDVVAFQRWKEQQATAEVEKEPEPATSGVTPTQLKAVRKLMRDSDPEYRELLAEREQTKQERAQAEEAMIGDAYDEIGKLAKESGFRLDDAGRLRLSRQVMLEIRNDDKLLRRWDRRDIGCVRDAFDAINEHLLKPIGGRPNGAAVDAATRRRASRLPTAPAGGSPTSSVKIPAQKEKGITQETHARAFELLQQSQRE